MSSISVGGTDVKVSLCSAKAIDARLTFHKESKWDLLEREWQRVDCVDGMVREESKWPALWTFKAFKYSS